MPFFIAITLGIILGLVRGGHIQALAMLRFRHPWLLALGAGIWLATIQFPLQQWIGPAPLGGMPRLAAQLLLLAFVWQNRHVPLLAVVGLGLLANFVVMAANGGQMPVDPALLQELGIEARVLRAQAQGMWVHFSPLGDAARLSFLGDWIILRRPFPWPGVLSPGDVVIAVGALLVAHRATVGEASGPAKQG